MSKLIPRILKPVLEPIVAEAITREKIRGKPPVTEKKRGKVLKRYIATDEGVVVPFSILEEVEIKKDSKQLEEEKSWIEDEGLASRPFTPESLLVLYESNATFFRTVNQIATDVAGLGWTLIPAEQALEGSEAGNKGNAEEKGRAMEFLSHPNPDEPLRKIVQALIIDWGVIGCHALEVIRSDGGQVAEIYQLPAQTMFVHKGKENGKRRQKYCQKRGQKRMWFKRFGLEYDISEKTGEKGEFPGDKAAHELIFSKTHYPGNDYYGIPNILPAVGSVLGLIGIRNYNLAFFRNYGVPAYLVTLSGDWEEGAEGNIAKFLNTEVKTSENAHKTLVLQLPEDLETGETGTATFEPLSIKEREGSFKVFYQVWQGDVLLAYSMPAYRVGILPQTSRLGSGGEARELTEVYKQSVVEPLQKDMEDLINFKLLEQGLDVKSWRIKFNDLDTRDVDKEVERYVTMIEHGLITPDDARIELNLGEKYPGGDRYWMTSNMKEVQRPVGKKRR